MERIVLQKGKGSRLDCSESSMSVATDTLKDENVVLVYGAAPGFIFIAMTGR